MALLSLASAVVSFAWPMADVVPTASTAAQPAMQPQPSTPALSTTPGVSSPPVDLSNRVAQPDNTGRAVDSQDVAGSWRSRPFSLTLHFGIATPVGAVGVAFDYAPFRWVSAGCGVGTNFVGPEGSCFVRFRPNTAGELAFYEGGGISGGPYTQSEENRLGLLAPIFGPLSLMGERRPSRHWQFATWINVECGFELRRLAGRTWRVYLGAAVLANPSDSQIEPSSAYSRSAMPVAGVMPYAGFAIGWAL
jgi:hypothetical protein